MAVPEGAAGWSINQIITISWTGSKISLNMALQLYNCTLHLFKDQPEDGPKIVQLYTPPVQRSAWTWPYNCTIVHSTSSKISLNMALLLYNCTLHLFKDLPEDGPTIVLHLFKDQPEHGPTIVQLYTPPVQKSAWRWSYSCTIVHSTCSHISLKMALQLYTLPVQRSAWIWPYNWTETCRWN
jgi:hypothetical protein